MIFFKIKVNACILIHPISNYNLWENIFKIPYFTYIAKENWKEYCNSINAMKFSLPAYRWSTGEQYLHIGYVGSITFKPTNLRSHPSKLFQLKIAFFPSTSTDPTLDPLPLVIVSTLFYM